MCKIRCCEHMTSLLLMLIEIVMIIWYENMKKKCRLNRFHVIICFQENHFVDNKLNILLCFLLSLSLLSFPFYLSLSSLFAFLSFSFFFLVPVFFLSPFLFLLFSSLSLFLLSSLVFDFTGNAGCSRPLVTPLACVHQTNVSTCTRVPSSSFRCARILDRRAAISIHVASILGSLFWQAPNRLDTWQDVISAKRTSSTYTVWRYV